MDPRVIVSGQQRQPEGDQRASSNEQGARAARSDALKEPLLVEFSALHGGQYVADGIWRPGGVSWLPDDAPDEVPDDAPAAGLPAMCYKFWTP